VRHSLFSVAAATLFTVMYPLTAFAQSHEIPQLNSCIEQFYDPGMYNYLTFKNKCSHSLTVVLVAKDGSGGGGTLELRPGGRDSVGRTKGKEPKVNSFEIYACPTGYLPMDSNNQVVSKPASSFKCQQREH
jgi:hypothetical protein